jgi:predicted nucleic acid-binding Zn finger protein
MKEDPFLGLYEKERYYKIYGDRFTKALKTVEEGKVKKYVIQDSHIERWIVVGSIKEYILVDDNYCSCYDFYHSVLQLQEIDKCYHLLAKMIAAKSQRYDTIEITFQQFQKFLLEWL